MSDRTIISDFFSISEFKSTVLSFIHDKYKFFPEFVDQPIDQLLESLIDNVNCYFEYPYVDKVYRDSYYNFYSTKHNSTNRNCARISFFSQDVSLDDFRNPKLFERIQSGFFGYITIRPTFPNIIGRTMLSPKALLQNGFICCLARSNVEINGVKLFIDAFPHSSQDGETITCAETTIWSVMEYFGMKYPEYKPVLPSRINRVLSNFSFERQLPSRGLTTEQISYALKEFDFGTRLYSMHESTGDDHDNEAFSALEFRRLFGCYVQSGIPLIAAIENDTLGHAIVIVGHKVIDHENIDLVVYEKTDVKADSGRISLYDYSDFIESYVAIDDNMSPYNIIPFEDPTINYNSVHFENCSIKNFIAPLYHKIYLEAGAARELMISFLENYNHNLPGEDIVLKLFFTSSRSFKAELNKKINMGVEANEIIIKSTMPKFIWVGIFTNPDLLRQTMANGLVVLDATEPTAVNSPILMVTPESIITYDPQEIPQNKHVVYNIGVNNFNIFANNLKGEWSLWQS